MTQQIRTSTTGELSASIEGHGEFNAQSVEFMGSTNDPDFLLRGMDASRGLIFYFPRFESGHYVLGAGSANKAFFEVDGALNGEVKEGVVDVTVDAEDAVSISFDFSIEDKDGVALIRIKGSGNFKGKVSWTDNGRALSNVILRDRYLGSMSPSPWARSDDLTMYLKTCEILFPAANTTISPFQLFSGKGQPGALLSLVRSFVNGSSLYGTTSVDGNGDWEMTPGRALPIESVRMRVLHEGCASEIVEYAVDPVGPLVITMPKEGDPFYYKNSLRGTGVPGARVELHKHGDGNTVYGFADVGNDRAWVAPLSIDLPLGAFTMTARQTLHGENSGWAHPVNFQVVGLVPPSIKVPASGETLSYRGFVGGTGTPGFEVKLFQHGDPNTVYSYADVQDNGTWYVSMRRDLPLGPFSMTANQTKDGVVSDWAVPVSFIVVDKKP